MTVELLRFDPQSARTRIFFAALAKCAAKAGITVTDTSTYGGLADLLLLWGPGAPNRHEPMRQQLAAGGHVVCADLAYWQRDQKVRLSIDGPHPQHWVMRRDWPAARVQSDGIAVDNRWVPTGPILVAGIGRKARVQYGDAVDRWEAAMITACRRRWPDRLVQYRRKQIDASVPIDVPVTVGDQPIDQALAGRSLLITWHSNVAVDAIRMGIPVVCQDGAAAAVCPSTLPEVEPAPLPTRVRDRFLANLAWFQWGATEAPACWRFLQELLA